MRIYAYFNLMSEVDLVMVVQRNSQVFFVVMLISLGHIKTRAGDCGYSKRIMPRILCVDSANSG